MDRFSVLNRIIIFAGGSQGDEHLLFNVASTTLFYTYDKSSTYTTPCCVVGGCHISNTVKSKGNTIQGEDTLIIGQTSKVAS